MSINCIHWRDCNHPRGGCCAMGVHDRPSFGTCRRCDSREPIHPDPAPAPTTPAESPAEPSLLQTVAHAGRATLAGMVGMGKAALGLDQVPPEVMADRLAICDQCEHSRPKDKPVEERRCGQLLDAIKPGTAPCGCGLADKTSLGGQACPLGKWASNDL